MVKNVTEVLSHPTGAGRSSLWALICILVFILLYAGCLRLLKTLKISWNFIDAPGKFNCQLKYDNLAVTVPNLVTSLNLTNCRLTIFCAVLLPHEAMRSAVLPRQVVHPSVWPSVTLRYRGHIGSNSWKIISRLISLTFSLSADPNITESACVCISRCNI